MTLSLLAEPTVGFANVSGFVGVCEVVERVKPYEEFVTEGMELKGRYESVAERGEDHAHQNGIIR